MRDACGVALERLGFRVIDAEHGEGALAELTRHGDEVAAVVVDLLMPGMPTPDLIRAIKERLPQVPILVATGSVLDEAARALLEGQVQGWLMKPFGEADLAAAFERLGVSAR